MLQRNEKRFALYAEMGTGKSKMLIDTLAWLYDQGDINALALLAPKGVYRNWADSELPTHMPAHICYRVGLWDAQGTKAQQAGLDALGRQSDDLHVLLMNIEALGRDLENNRAYAFLDKFLTSHRALLAVDESTVIKNPQATRTKACLKLRRLAPYRRILSGQPSPNGPLDLYSQCEFLEPGILGHSSFYTFKAHFAQLVPMKLGNRSFKKVAGYQNLGELHDRLSEFSFIVKKADCLDLPEKLPPVIRDVDLGPKQQRAYDQMKKLAIVEIEQALAGRAETVDFQLLQQATTVQGPQVDPRNFSTANLVITQMLRLHQILCGFLVNDARQPVLFNEPNPRLEDLMELLDEISGKVVIWATYKVTIRQIAERIAKEHGPDSVVTYYGDTSMEDRRKAIKLFQDPDSPARFFISNRTGARGITLTASNTSVYYSYDHDQDTHAQSQDRIHRIGQHWPCSYIYQRARGTVEDKILEALKNKESISSLITASNWKQFLGA